MSDTSNCSFSIELAEGGSKVSQNPLQSQEGGGRIYYDGDHVRGHVVVSVNNVYHLKCLTVELVGKSMVKTTRLEGAGVGPKSFTHKEKFLRLTQTLSGTNLEPSPSLSSIRSSLNQNSVTSHGRVVQFNRGVHRLPFELALEPGCTPGSIYWENTSMPSQNSHNVTASITYCLKVVCHQADTSKASTLYKTSLDVGGFEHSRESLKAMISKGSGKSKLGNLSFPLMDGNITYAATLDARGYHHGDTALLTLVLDNRLGHHVNGISVKFNNFVSLVGSSGKHSSSNSTNINLNSSGLLSTSSSLPMATDEAFSESEVLTVVNDRYTVKTNESVKRAIQIVIPHNAFSTTKFTRSVNLMAYLDVSICVESQTPSVSEKNFQVPIYIINHIPARETTAQTPPILSPSGSSSNLNLSSSRNSSSKDLSIATAMLTISGPPNIHSDLPSIITWTNDDEVSSCTICANEFNIIRRRHHCRACGRIMCRNCCSQIKVEALFGNKSQKVCSKCGPEIQAMQNNISTEELNGQSTTPPPTIGRELAPDSFKHDFVDLGEQIEASQKKSLSQQETDPIMTSKETEPTSAPKETRSSYNTSKRHIKVHSDVSDGPPSPK